LAQAFAGQAAVALQNARLYSQLSRAYDQLDRIDRTKSDFINVAAHELRTPLTVLRAFSQMMVKDPDITEDPTKHRMAEGMYQNAVRLHAIVDSMVDMARIDSRALKIHATEISLPRLIRGVGGDLVESLEQRNLALEVDEMDALPEIEADPDLMRKVFRNLLLNAIKYTPDGGTISVRGQQVAPNASKLDVPGVEIIVSDTGIGIDPEYQDLIFAKFYQTGEVALHSSGETKFKGGGPGLGLSIAKGIVEAHRGRIWVESIGYDEETYPGSDFHVVLPVRQRQEEVGA
jgi:signal transduction histidine kinase